MRFLVAPFSSLWRQRELLWQFTLRNVELRHKGSHLGLIWSFLNPLLILGLYVFVFGYIFNGHFGIIPNETRADYGLGIFLGLSFFHFVAEVLGLAPGIVVANPNFVKKVVFPLEILPAAQVGAALFHFFVSCVLAVGSIAFFRHSLLLGTLWLPVVALPIVLFALGVAWFFSALGVFFRDTAQIMQFLTMVLMFSSAVFYSAEKIQEPAWSFLRYNPLLLAIEMARNAALWAKPINWNHLIYLYGSSYLVCCIGFAMFRKAKPAFADVL